MNQDKVSLFRQAVIVITMQGGSVTLGQGKTAITITRDQTKDSEGGVLSVPIYRSGKKRISYDQALAIIK